MEFKRKYFIYKCKLKHCDILEKNERAMQVGNIYLLTSEKLKSIDYYKLSRHHTEIVSKNSNTDLIVVEYIESVPMIDTLEMYIRRLYENVRCDNICVNSDWYCLTPNSFVDIIMIIHYWKIEFGKVPQPKTESWSRTYIDQCFLFWSSSTINLSAEEVCNHFKINLVSDKLVQRFWQVQSEKFIVLDKFILDTLDITKQTRKFKRKFPLAAKSLTDIEFGYLLMDSNNLKELLNLYLTIQFIYEKYTEYKHRKIEFPDIDECSVSDAQSFSSNETQYDGSDYD